MKITRTFSIPIQETAARERVAAFCRKSGHKQLPGSDSELHFQRGSLSDILFSFNPTRWPCVVNVYIIAKAGLSQIKVEAEISTDPTEWRFGEELLTAELNLLESAVAINKIQIYDVGDLKKRVAAFVFRIVGILASFLITIILGVFTGLFAYIKLNISILGALAIGAGVLLVFGALLVAFWGRRKKT